MEFGILRLASEFNQCNSVLVFFFQGTIIESCVCQWSSEGSSLNYSESGCFLFSNSISQTQNTIFVRYLFSKLCRNANLAKEREIRKKRLEGQSCKLVIICVLVISSFICVALWIQLSKPSYNQPYSVTLNLAFKV